MPPAVRTDFGSGIGTGAEGRLVHDRAVPAGLDGAAIVEEVVGVVREGRRQSTSKGRYTEIVPQLSGMSWRREQNMTDKNEENLPLNVSLTPWSTFPGPVVEKIRCRNMPSFSG